MQENIKNRNNTENVKYTLTYKNVKQLKKK